MSPRPCGPAFRPGCRFPRWDSAGTDPDGSASWIIGDVLWSRWLMPEDPRVLDGGAVIFRRFDG